LSLKHLGLGSGGAAVDGCNYAAGFDRDGDSAGGRRSRSANQILQDRMRELVHTAFRKFHARLWEA